MSNKSHDLLDKPGSSEKTIQIIKFRRRALEVVLLQKCQKKDKDLFNNPEQILSFGPGKSTRTVADKLGYRN